MTWVRNNQLHILEKSGENIKAVKDKDKKTIIWKTYNPNIPLMPTRMNLDAVQAKDQFDVPMHEIIGADIKKLETDKNQIQLTQLLFIAKNIERIGDHATNIAEQVYFLITGDYLEGQRPKG